MAAEKGHVEAVRALLLHDADAAARDQDGSTPLHVAAENQQSAVVQELLGHGVDPDAENAVSTPTPSSNVRRRGNSTFGA